MLDAKAAFLLRQPFRRRRESLHQDQRFFGLQSDRFGLSCTYRQRLESATVHIWAGEARQKFELDRLKLPFLHLAMHQN